MQIYINNQLAEHSMKSLSISQTSILLNDVGGDIFIDLDFPLTTNNKRIFSFSHRPETKFLKNEFDVRIEVGSIQRMGKGVLKKVSDVYSLNVGFNYSDFFSKIKNKTLKDIQLKDVIQFSAQSEASLNHSQGFYYHDKTFLSWTGENYTHRSIDCDLKFDSIFNKVTSFTINTNYIRFNDNGTFKITITGDFILSRGSNFGLHVRKRTKYPSSTYDIWTDVITLLIAPTPCSTSINHTAEFTVNKGDVFYFNISCLEEMMNDFLGSQFWAEMKTSNFGIIVSQEDSTLNLSNYCKKKYPEVNFCLAPVYNPELLASCDQNEIDTYKMAPFQNLYIGNTFPWSIDTQNKTFRNVLSPFLYLPYIIEKIATFTGYTIDRSIFFEYPELNQLIIYNTFCQIEPDLQKRSLYNSLLWDLENNLGDMLISDFITVFDLLGAKLIVNSQRKTIDIVFLKDILTDKIEYNQRVRITSMELEPAYDAYELSLNPDEDLGSSLIIDMSDSKKKINFLADSEVNPEIGGINDVYFNTKKRAYYINKYNTETKKLEWGMYALLKKKLTTKTSENKRVFSVESKISPILGGILETVLDKKALQEISSDIGTIYKQSVIGLAKQAGKIKNIYETIDDEVFVGVSFYRGMKNVYAVNDSILGELPTISNDIYDNRGVKWPDANIALRLEGEYGLYETFFKTPLRWLCEDAKKVSISIPYMPISEYSHLDIHKRVRLNSQNYLIDTLKAELTDEGVFNIDIEAYTCY